MPQIFLFRRIFHLAIPSSFSSLSFLPSTFPLACSARFHGNKGCLDKPLKVIFVLPDDSVKEVVGYEGQTLLDVAAAHHLPMEGACAGSCACSTCHVYLEEKDQEKFPEATDEENDMIDQAFFPEPASRLGCQLKLTQSLHNGLRVIIPKATRNIVLSGVLGVFPYPRKGKVLPTLKRYCLEVFIMEGFSPFNDGGRTRGGGGDRFHNDTRNRTPLSGIVVDKSCRVYIKNIPLSRLESEGGNALRSEFESFGPIEAYRLFTERSGRYSGNGLCTYLNDADAALAVYMMNGKEIEEGEKLEVSLSRDHGVILLHENREKHKHFIHDTQKRSTDLGTVTQAGEKEGQWVHDKYALLEQGEDMDVVLSTNPHRSRGRGRGFRRGRGDRWGRGRGEYPQRHGNLEQKNVEKMLDEYVQKRDSQLLNKQLHTTTDLVGDHAA